MKVVLATTARTRGGVWRHIEDLSSGLHADGHRAVVALLPEAHELKDAAARAGLETHDFHDTVRWRGWIWHGHLHDTYDRAFLRAALLRGMRGPTVLTEHLPHTNASDPKLQPGPRHPLAHSAKTLAKRLQYRLVDRVIAVSPSSKSFIVERYGRGRTEIAVVMNGVQPSLSAIGMPAPEIPVRVVCVGAVAYQKGFDVLVDAATAGPLPSWRAIVVGEGAAREALEARAKDRGVVTFIGWSDDVASLMAEADIFCMPSRWESSPYAALEAMDAGRPVVATDVDGLRDMVDDGVTGLLVRPEDADGLASALERLAGSPDLRERMGLAGRARAGEFSVSRMLEQTLIVYEQAARRS